MMRPPILAAIVLSAACGGGGSGGGGATGTGGDAGPSASSSTSTTSTGGAGGSPTGTTSAEGGAVGACAECEGACADTANDPRSCGACGHACGPKEHCDRGACATPLCLIQGLICPNDHLCCGDECCPAWKMCCNVPGGSKPTCVPVDAGACPTTCAGCP